MARGWLATPTVPPELLRREEPLGPEVRVAVLRDGQRLRELAPQSEADGERLGVGEHEPLVAVDGSNVVGQVRQPARDEGGHEGGLPRAGRGRQEDRALVEGGGGSMEEDLAGAGRGLQDGLADLPHEVGERHRRLVGRAHAGRASVDRVAGTPRLLGHRELDRRRALAAAGGVQVCDQRTEDRVGRLHREREVEALEGRSSARHRARHRP